MQNWFISKIDLYELLIIIIITMLSGYHQNITTKIKDFFIYITLLFKLCYYTYTKTYLQNFYL